MIKKLDSLYLDCNASAPLLPCARQALLQHLDTYGNPSSSHALGQQARATIDSARQTIQATLNAQHGRFVFTSGASESNALALTQDWQHVLLAPTDHDSLVVHAQYTYPQTLTLLPVTKHGLLDIDALDSQLRTIRATSQGTILLCLTWAHNEIGTYYDDATLQAIVRLSRVYDAALHIDAAQAVGKIPVNIDGLAPQHPALSVALSAHKVGGPKGIGGFYTTRQETRPLTYGGGQEYALRPGSEHTPAIAAFAAAVAHTHNTTAQKQWQKWRDAFEDNLQQSLPQAVIIARDAPRLPNTSCFALPPVLAETMLVALDLDNIAIGKGSACAQAKNEPSRTLKAIGHDSLQSYTMRASCGMHNNKDDFDRLLAALQKNVENMSHARDRA
ncbi:MAG: aminotransferase class V-fold PLP-dependent enzyme [Alphaproteobacteria bacterium GM202ARS2]|nr:aminotransferase class V-fold PLP-dependent enzyme [Alphaproteobacteria bacterium GM202ARS2]